MLNLVQEYREAKAAVTATDADCARIGTTLPAAPEGGRTDAESVEVYQRTGYAAAINASAAACERLVALEDAALSTEATSAAGLRLQGEILHGLAEGFDYGEPVNKSLRLARTYALRLADGEPLRDRQPLSKEEWSARIREIAEPALADRDQRRRRRALAAGLVIGFIAGGLLVLGVVAATVRQLPAI